MTGIPKKAGRHLVAWLVVVKALTAAASCADLFMTGRIDLAELQCCVPRNVTSEVVA